MDTSLFSYAHGQYTSQEIPHILENLKGVYHYKRLHIRRWTKYSLYQYTNKCVSLCTLLQIMMYRRNLHSLLSPA